MRFRYNYYEEDDDAPRILTCATCGESSDIDHTIHECECGNAYCSAHFDSSDHDCDFRR